MIKLIGNSPIISSNTYSISTIKECLDYFKDQDIIGIDTETIGDCWSGYVYTLQLGNKDIQFVIDCTLYDIRYFKELLEDKTKLFIGQNLKYDLKFLYHKGIKLSNLYDTFLAELVLTTGIENRKGTLGLDALAKKYCGVVLDKTIRGKINYLGLTDSIVQYAANDVKYLEDIMILQKKELERLDLLKVIELECEVTKVFAEIEYYGMKLDKEKWLVQAKKREKEAIFHKKALDDYILTNDKSKFSKFIDKQLSLWDSNFTCKISWDSPKQVLEVLQVEGIRVTSVNEKIIERYSNRFPLVKLYLNYKNHQTAISKFGEKYLKWVNTTINRVCTSYFQILNTGRVSSGEKDKFANVQQLPATNEVRNCFIAEKGYSFVDCDYSTMELVIAGCVSKEPSWLKAFEEGWDLHSVVAEAVYKEAWLNAKEESCQYYISKQKCSCKDHKSMRDKIKTLNYLSLYGGGPRKLSESINIPLEEAKSILSTYFSNLPELTKFFNLLKNFGKRNLYIRTTSPYKRIRWFEDPKGDFGKIGLIERQSGNTFISGSGADIVKLSMVKMWNIREQENLDVKFVLQLHDAIICEAKDDIAEYWLKIQKNCMIEAFKEVIGYPIDVSGDISKFWKK